MAWICSEHRYEDTKLDLVDGYLPSRNTLIALSRDKGTIPFSGKTPENLPDDEIAVSLFANIIKQIGKERDSTTTTLGYGGSEYCNMWIIYPHKKWPSEFSLSEEIGDNESRRSILRITRGWDEYERQAYLENLVKLSSFMNIPESCYKNLPGFQERVDELFDSVAEPYIAPPIVAMEYLKKANITPVEIEF